MARTEKCFKFDVGNSNTGPLGMVIRVYGTTKKEAVEKANAFLNSVGELGYPEGQIPRDSGVDYLTVYFGPNLTVRYIDDSETEVADEVQIPS